MSAADSKNHNHNHNKLLSEDRFAHDWYRFVLSFPAHLVRHYLNDFQIKPGEVILDPFCGTGTTLVEAKLNNIESLGIEANAFAQFASRVKTDWSVPGQVLRNACEEIAFATNEELTAQGINDETGNINGQNAVNLRTLNEDQNRLILTDSISPLPLHKTLVLLDHLSKHRNEQFYNHALLALANALVYKISNLKFGPEVGVDKPKPDAPVISSWLSEIEKISADLDSVIGREFPKSTVFFADSRDIKAILPEKCVDAIITSPPYPNEKDYTRTTRLESVLLGMINNREELRALKKTLVRSNTRGVYKEDTDDIWVAKNESIQNIAKNIENRRIEMGKNSGFEKLYGRVTQLYFGGMARHLSDLRPILKPGARLAYVVGDQASYLRVMIRTGELLAEIAQSIGYELIRIDLFRTRFSTATRDQLREEVVVLKWNG